MSFPLQNGVAQPVRGRPGHLPISAVRPPDSDDPADSPLRVRALSLVGSARKGWAVGVCCEPFREFFTRTEPSVLAEGRRRDEASAPSRTGHGTELKLRPYVLYAVVVGSGGRCRTRTCDLLGVSETL